MKRMFALLVFFPVAAFGQGLSIPQLPNAATLSLSDLVPIDKSVAATVSPNGRKTYNATLGQLQSLIGGGTVALPQNQIFVGNASGIAAAAPMSGDCAIVASGAITCTSTGGVSFGSLATANAAPAGTLTGTTLAAGVTASSLISAAGGNFGNLAYYNAATPPAIGGTTPAAGSFTTLSATGTATVPGLLVSRNTYNSSGTITILGTKAVVHEYGATGGSGGASVGTGVAGTGGTGAGCALFKYLSGLTVNNTFTYTMGSGGAAGTSGGGNGGNGGTATLASGTQTLSPSLVCNGSNGSTGASTNVATSGTAGGTATGGDTNITGQAGFPAIVGSTLYSGFAGATDLSVGAPGVAVSASSVAGNAGNNSGLIIEWYQ